MSVLGPLIRSFEASAAVEGYRFAAGANDGAKVRRAASATDRIAGVTERMGAGAAGDMLDVVLAGPTEVLAGGTFAAFDPLTSDATGRAIRAVPVAGQVVRVGGYALADAVAGDIVQVNVAPSIINTPA
ncbi:DUF2190 family protein [Methylopila sp. 73B]|uniref:DUF2190 family protein n=1 Tax=Methylopila sp. 73B TaxID=1120792 RepID=UPI000373E7A9|nr:DUF2190 family protein [Methylopila sp. 73B]